MQIRKVGIEKMLDAIRAGIKSKEKKKIINNRNFK